MRNRNDEITHCEKTHTARNVTGNLSGRRKMTPDGNTDLYKRMQNTGNVNYMAKPTIVFFYTVRIF